MFKSALLATVAVSASAMELNQDAPVEEVPMEEAPMEEAPVELMEEEVAPVDEAPVEEAPVEEGENWNAGYAPRYPADRFGGAGRFGGSRRGYPEIKPAGFGSFGRDFGPRGGRYGPAYGEEPAEEDAPAEDAEEENTYDPYSSGFGSFGAGRGGFGPRGGRFGARGGRFGSRNGRFGSFYGEQAEEDAPAEDADEEKAPVDGPFRLNDGLYGRRGAPW